MLNLIVLVQALFSVIKELLKACINVGHALGHDLNFVQAKAEVKLFHKAVLLQL